MAESVLLLSTTIIFAVVLYSSLSHAKLINSKDEKLSDSTELRKPSSSETNIFNFVRLFFLRMIYGFANMIGIGDFLEDFAGGIFAPPSADYDGFSYDGGIYDEYKDYDDYDY